MYQRYVFVEIVKEMKAVKSVFQVKAIDNQVFILQSDVKVGNVYFFCRICANGL